MRERREAKERAEQEQRKKSGMCLSIPFCCSVMFLTLANKNQSHTTHNQNTSEHAVLAMAHYGPIYV